MGTAFLYGNGGSGGTGASLTVTAPVGVTVTVSKDGKTKTKVAGSDGIVVFKGLASGSWTVTITDGSQTAQKVAAINTDYALVISFNTIPEFTYTGDYEIVNDADEPITASQGNWKIRFLTSGTLTFTNLVGAENGIDVFCVGGGGGGKAGNTGSNSIICGGGGGGYTLTEKNVKVEAGTSYSIEIGAGGAGGTDYYVNPSGNGGATSAFGKTANGGYGIPTGLSGAGAAGGNGGSGGSSAVRSTDLPLNGGTDGSDGESYGSYAGGTGQGTTTREFGEPEGNLYSSGGSAKTATAAGESGAANTGNGGDGSNQGYTAGSGGSGIVIIRNAREVA